MFDTIGLRLRGGSVGGANFLEAVPPLLTATSIHHFEDGGVSITGKLGNLTISCSEWAVKIKEGSLCKWYLGDNLQALGKADTKRAIEALCDTLYLPFDKADVTRLDVSNNFVMKRPVSLYLEHLGNLTWSKRLVEPDGIYYKQRDRRLCFYDKIKEQRALGCDIPELYRERQVLRYEQRYLERIPARLNLPTLTAKMLTEAEIYTTLINNWRDAYKAIHKINETEINWGMVKNKKDLYKIGLIALCEIAGGEQELLEQIARAQKRGMTAKQAYDLRQAVMSATRIDGALSFQSDAIKELDTKVNDAFQMYR